MFKVERTSYGIKMTLAGFIEKEESIEWLAEVKRVVKAIPLGFNAFVDMRELKPLPAESQPATKEVHKFCKENGGVRSVVILDSAVTTMQFKHLAKETGIYDVERYIDASSNPNWEEVALLWLNNAVDPDLQ